MLHYIAAIPLRPIIWMVTKIDICYSVLSMAGSTLDNVGLSCSSNVDHLISLSGDMHGTLGFRVIYIRV